MVKKTLKRAAIGFLSGMAAGNLIAFLTSGFDSSIVSPEFLERVGSEETALFLQTLLSGLIGFAGCAGMTFWEMDWSLVRTVITHFALICGVFVPVSYFLCWFNEPLECLIMIGFMAVGYFIMWLIMSAIYKAQTKKLNELQRKKLEEAEKEKNK